MTRGRPPRVAHVTTAHTSTDNRILRKECSSLAEAGFDVHLLAVADGYREEGGVSIVALPRRRGRVRRMVLGPLDAWRALQALQPDVVHVHDPELIPLALLWSRVSRRPAVYDAHEDLAKQVMSKPYLQPQLRPLIALFAKALERLAGRYLTIVAATPAIARNYRPRTPVLVQNFPWLRDFPEPSPVASSQRRAVYIGGISRIRGVEEMLRAATGPPGFDVIMAGSVESPAVEAAVLAHANVDYRGVLPASEMARILNEAHVGLVLFHPLPNHLEAQPTKLFEYMATGRPFVASDFPAWRGLVGSFDCGEFVDPLDSSAIARAVAAVLDDPERAAEMGRRGRAAVEEHFSFENEAARLVDLMHRLSGQPNGSASTPIERDGAAP